MLHGRGAALQASDPRVRKWAEEGVTDGQALSALDVAEERRARGGNPQAINAGLLDAILGDIRNPKAPRGKPSRHANFDQIDYREGISPDGRF